MDINRRTMADLYVAFSAAFQRGLRSRQDQTAWERIATRIPSSTAKNVYPFLGQWPKMRKWLDERTLKQLAASRYELVNDDYESSVTVERNAVEDDEYSLYSTLFEEAGAAAAEWPSDVVFQVLKGGKTGLCYDGKPFFATDHPHKLETAVSNLDTGGAAPWYLLDISRVLKPLIWQPRRMPKLVPLDRETDKNVFFEKRFVYGIDGRGAAGYGLWQFAHRSELALDATNYKSARQAMMERTNDTGSSLGVRPMLLVVPPELEIPAKELVQASQNAQGATNILASTAEVFVTDLVRE